MDIAPRAARALEACAWPNNATQLRRVVREAASRTDVVDLQHLAPEVFSGRAVRHPGARAVRQPAGPPA